MKIDESNYEMYLASINQAQLQIPNQQNGKNSVSGGTDPEKDSYIPGINASDAPIPSSIYNADGIMVENFPPITNVNTDSTATTDSALLNQLSETFRANTDSILSAMESLGLTLEDLSDKDNLTALANAMNEGAAALGVPQLDNLDEAVNSLYNLVTGSAASSETAAGEGAAAGGGSDDEEETTTEIVTINGVTYLETTTTENGITTTTRTRIGGSEEKSL